MALTEEEKKLIERNRKRALELKKQHQEKLQNEAKKREEGKAEKDGKGGGKEAHVVLEDFEIGASDHVSKSEAMQMYCLPEGTLAVCAYEEKINPRHKSWTPMKLYDRSEIRKRARERHGGLEGLQRERKRRQQKRFRKDLEETKDIFKR